jgi:UDP-glucose 4-epimerase
VFGTDYPTPDGTCIRDYIHVEDLARAHLDALRYLEHGGAPDTFNCGYGRGFSVREVLRMVEQVSGVRLRIEEGGRRAGDPSALVADASRIGSVLGWRPERDDLRGICSTAFRWEARLRGLPASGTRTLHGTTQGR